MSEPADLNVDELRRRARRRLIGAIVLALAAAVVVPMLLESEPRPLGEDVSVKIPPVDDGKFVNRLNEPSGKAPVGGTAPADASKSVAPSDRTSDSTSATKSADASKAASGSITQSPPAKEPPASQPSASSSPASSEAAKDASTDAAKNAAAPASTEDKRAPQASTEDKRTPASGTKGAASVAGGGASSGTIRTDAPKVTADANRTTAPRSSEPAAAVPSPAATSEAAKDGFSVQLAAFADDKGANALAGKLKKLGYAAYTEPLKTSRGTLWRVRVGPFPSRDAANQVRDHLKTQGQNGIVAPAR